MRLCTWLAIGLSCLYILYPTCAVSIERRGTINESFSFENLSMSGGRINSQRLGRAWVCSLRGDIVNTSSEIKERVFITFYAYDIFDTLLWEVTVYIKKPIPPEKPYHFNEKISCNARTPYRLSFKVLD